MKMLTENLDSRNLEQSIWLIGGIFIQQSLMSLHRLTCLNQDLLLNCLILHLIDQALNQRH